MSCIVKESRKNISFQTVVHSFVSVVYIFTLNRNKTPPKDKKKWSPQINGGLAKISTLFNDIHSKSLVIYSRWSSFTIVKPWSIFVRDK